MSDFGALLQQLMTRGPAARPPLAGDTLATPEARIAALVDGLEEREGRLSQDMLNRVEFYRAFPDGMLPDIRHRAMQRERDSFEDFEVEMTRRMMQGDRSGITEQAFLDAINRALGRSERP